MNVRSGTILMYNCSGPEFSKLRQIFAMLRMRMHPVTPDRYHVSLIDLANGKGEPAETAPAPMEEAMLVFCGVRQPLLNQVLEVIRLAKLPPIPMKAVLTMNNLQWNTMQLYEELCREREAMEAQKNGQAPAEPKPDEAKSEESAEAPKAEEVKAEEAKTEEPKAEEKPEEKA